MKIIVSCLQLLNNSDMNPGSSDQAFNSLINVDIGWMQQIYAAQTKPPDPGRSSNTMEREVINIMKNAAQTKRPDPGRSSSTMEMEAVNVMSAANKTSRMIAAPAIDTGAMGNFDLAAGTKSGREMYRVAESLINSVGTTSVTTTAVPRSACNRIISNVSVSANTSALHEFSSGPRAAEAAGGLCRGAGALKVKKKRVRPSRRVPTTMVKTDTSNFKAMVEQFTGIPPTCTTTQESTAAPSASSSRQSIGSASSPFFGKPLPHPVLSKLSNSSSGAPAPASAHPKEQTMPLNDAAFIDKLRN